MYRNMRKMLKLLFTTSSCAHPPIHPSATDSVEETDTFNAKKVTGNLSGRILTGIWPKDFTS
jgi:hypothetical protein